MRATGTKVIVVTGASSGIGRAAVLALLDAGFHVYAGVRRDEDAERLRSDAPPGAADRLTTLLLDVTDPVQIQAAVKRVERAVGAAGLWGLVNNAGISVAGPLEHVPSDDLRRQFEVNVIGQVSVTRAFLPLLRRARGRIVTTGSVAGFVAMPGLGPYAMTKHAMEAFSDSLRRELRPWGIEVSLLEPGTIATDIWDKGQSAIESTLQRPPPGLVADYGRLVDSMRRVARASVAHASPAALVARDIVHACTARRPRTRYCMGADSRLQRWIARLPDRWADALLARFLRWG